METDQQKCQAELEAAGLVPRKYHGQVFTTDPAVIDRLVEEIARLHRPGTKIVEIGGGLGYITAKLIERFEEVDVLEVDSALFDILNKKFIQQKGGKSLHVQTSAQEIQDSSNSLPGETVAVPGHEINLIQGNILEYEPPEEDYLLVGNIPFHLSGRLYRRFMSELKHKPYGMVFITDKNYAQTLMGQPPRSYRVSLQAQSYGDIEIVADVPPQSVYPPPKVMSCIMKITQNDIVLPENFWEVVNYHWENFPTKEVESPKTVGLEGWIKLCKKSELRTS